MKVRSGATLFLIIIGLIFTCANSSLACWAAPPQSAWGESQCGEFEFKRDNMSGRVTVYATGNRIEPLWDVTIPDFHSLFSQIVLMDKGQTILHLRGNHQVNKLTDTAVHVFQSNGAFCRIKASYFIDELVVPDQRLSVASRFAWMSNIHEVRADGFTIINAAGEEKDVKIEDLEMTKITED